MKKYLVVTMPDNSEWAVPVELIARNRAKCIAQDGDIESAYAQTVQDFEDDESEIGDWASGNMDWRHVRESAIRISSDPMRCVFQHGWMTGAKRFIDELPDYAKQE